MKTTLEQRHWFSLRGNERDYGWAASCATAGAVVWAACAVLGRMGTARVDAIELLFLFAPLVIVPLGMELARVIDGVDRFERLARRLQPFGAGLALVALWLPPGRTTALAAVGWLLVCVLMAGSGLAGLGRALCSDVDRKARATRVAVAIARLDLLVGGTWLVASRWGIHPLGIQEPISLLTAVHFHFAGFATAMIAAATLKFAEQRCDLCWLKHLVLMVAGLPILVAAGFAISPAVKMTAAVLFSGSVAVLAIAMRSCGRKAEDPTARLLLQLASGAVFAGVMFSAAYAVADYMGWDALTIPQMAKTHGILNSFGFCLAGLLGWLVENSTPYW